MTEQQIRNVAIEARRQELLTVKEFAYMVRKHPEYVREQCRRGMAGACKIGGTWYVDVAQAVIPQLRIAS